MAQKKLIKTELGNINVINRLMQESDKEYKNFNASVEQSFINLRNQVKRGNLLLEKMKEATIQYGQLQKDFEKLGLNFADFQESKDYKTFIASRVVGVENLVAEIKKLVE